jgi:hypothetical protein
VCLTKVFKNKVFSSSFNDDIFLVFVFQIHFAGTKIIYQKKEQYIQLYISRHHHGQLGPMVLPAAHVYNIGCGTKMPHAVNVVSAVKYGKVSFLIKLLKFLYIIRFTNQSWK